MSLYGSAFTAPTRVRETVFPVRSVRRSMAPLHPTLIQRTRDCCSKPGAAAGQKWTAKIRYPRKIPPFQHHDDPGCCPCAEGAAGALQKNAPAPHVMSLGMAPYSFAQYDLAGNTDSTPTSPRNHTAFAPAWLEIGRFLGNHAQHGSQPQLHAASEKRCAIHGTREQKRSARDSE